MKIINNVQDLLLIAEEYYDYLKGKIEFDKNGWPIFRKGHFLMEKPGFVITFQNRKNKVVTDKAHTLLCLFSPDRNIYPRFTKLFDELNEYKKYMGVASACVFRSSGKLIPLETVNSFPPVR